MCSPMWAFKITAMGWTWKLSPGRHARHPKSPCCQNPAPLRKCHLNPRSIQSSFYSQHLNTLSAGCRIRCHELKPTSNFGGPADDPPAVYRDRKWRPYRRIHQSNWRSAWWGSPSGPRSSLRCDEPPLAQMHTNGDDPRLSLDEQVACQHHRGQMEVSSLLCLFSSSLGICSSISFL